MMNRTDNEATILRLKNSISQIDQAIISLSFIAPYAVYILRQEKEDLKNQLWIEEQTAKQYGW